MPTDELRDHEARCTPHVALLRMFAGAVADGQLPADAVEQVAQATSAILAEAAAAWSAAFAAMADATTRSASLSLLVARQARLEHAAEDAVASAREAAEGGNLAALRQRLQRFEALTSAMWTVQWECAVPSGVIRAEGMKSMPVPREDYEHHHADRRNVRGHRH